MSGMMTKVWGPGCWLFLHCMVAGYPDKIDKKNKKHVARRKHTIQFLKQLPYVLPCKYCRESFIKFSKELPVEKYANSNKDLCLWLYKMHFAFKGARVQSKDSIHPELFKHRNKDAEKLRNKYLDGGGWQKIDGWLYLKALRLTDFLAKCQDIAEIKGNIGEI